MTARTAAANRSHAVCSRLWHVAAAGCKTWALTGLQCKHSLDRMHCRSAWPACSVQAGFAQPTLVAAHRRLLRAALADASNTAFALVSESCIPLYHPALLWAQLLSEAHVSRVSDGAYSVHRWNDAMSTEHLRESHFQKSSQWSSLSRAHADIIANDQHVWPVFKTYCRALVRCPTMHALHGPLRDGSARLQPAAGECIA